MSHAAQPSGQSNDRGLVVQGLTKRYRKGRLANDGINLRIRPGEVFGLLGPNGAGKTTLVKQIIGLLAPTAGSIVLDGHDVVANPSLARELCSYLPQGALPIDSLKLGEAVELTGRICGGDREGIRRRASELVAALQLEEWVDTLGARSSGGVKRLTGFIMAAIRPASLVILDEPTNDVDPLRRRLLWRQVRQLGRNGAAVLLVTHNVLEAEQSVDRLVIIDGGRIVAEGTPSALKADDRQSLRLQLNLVPGVAEPSQPWFVRRQFRSGTRLRLLIDADHAGEAISWASAQTETGVAEEFALGASTLEDAYVRLICGHEIAESDEGTEVA